MDHWSTPPFHVPVSPRATAEKVAQRTDDPQVVVVIQTDGLENASTQYTWNDLNALIKEKTAQGWQFVFLGAGIDAYQQGARMGLAAANTVSYDRRNSGQTFAAAARNTRMYAAGTATGMSFSDDQRQAAGDIHWASHRPASPTPPASASTPQPATAAKSLVDDIAL